MKKRLLSLFLVMMVFTCSCLSTFAADTGIDIIDSPLQYYFENQLLGVQKGTGVTLVCPNGDYSTVYTGGTLVSCPYDGEALVLADANGVKAKKYETGGGSAGTGGVGRRPSGYLDDAGTPTYNADGNLILLMSHDWSKAYANYDYLIWQCEHGTGTLTTNSYYHVFECTQTSCSIPFTFSSDRVGSNKLFLTYKVQFRATAPVSGYYTVPSQVIGKKSYAGYWSGTDVDIKVSKSRSSYSKGSTITLTYSHTPSGNAYNDWDVLNFTRAPYLVCEPSQTTISTSNNIAINQNVWNGNIYQDNSTNLTYIYPQYTTINENNETVTNISENPIIYDSTTNQYYTYDSVTNNYYYITYVTETPTPTPSPDPTPTPDPGTDPTPTPAPGGDTGDTSSILDVLVEIRDNLIQGFADIKATLAQGWADLSANFTLAIENLTINIQNFFQKGLSGSKVDPNIPGGGSSTPETGDKGDGDSDSSSSGSGWNWNPLKWLSDLLQNIVEKILKSVWKLITGIFGFLLWLLSLVGKVLPFLPSQAVLALTAGAIIVTILRIIKFITGR